MDELKFNYVSRGIEMLNINKLKLISVLIDLIDTWCVSFNDSSCEIWHPGYFSKSKIIKQHDSANPKIFFCCVNESKYLFVIKELSKGEKRLAGRDTYL